MCDVQTATLVKNVVLQGIQVHGSLGVPLETPLADFWVQAANYGLADGPTEAHTAQVAKTC